MALGDHADRKEADVFVEVECLVVEDEGLSRDDPIPTSLSTADVEHKPDPDKHGRINFKLDKDSKPVFSFKTDIYQPDWTTCVRVLVKENA